MCVSVSVSVSVCVWNFSKEVKLVPMSPALYLFIYFYCAEVFIYLSMYLPYYGFMEPDLLCICFLRLSLE